MAYNLNTSNSMETHFLELGIRAIQWKRLVKLDIFDRNTATSDNFAGDSKLARKEGFTVGLDRLLPCFASDEIIDASYVASSNGSFMPNIACKPLKQGGDHRGKDITMCQKSQPPPHE